MRGNVQVVRHEPPAQSVPDPQTCPQEPQLFESLARSAQRFPQRLVPLGHAQLPAMQTCVGAHAYPHVPQLRAELPVAVSHPFASFPSQPAKPGAHVYPHAPLTHAAVE
jgi:hypothetical protein